MTAFQTWFTTFLSEKDIPFERWTLMASNGDEHHIDTDVVIEAVHNCSAKEQKGIKDIIVKIDFANGNINHFFKHLAQGLAENY